LSSKRHLHHSVYTPYVIKIKYFDIYKRNHFMVLNTGFQTTMCR
jgi:hypothetical protein